MPIDLQEHLCVVPNCEEVVNAKRYALGYRTCLKHGEQRRTFPVAPAYNKGGYQLITPANVEHIGKKG